MSDTTANEPAGQVPRDEAGATPSGTFLRVRAERLVQDWKEAYERALAQLEAHAVPDTQRRALARAAVERALAGEAWPAGSDAVAETLAALRGLVLETRPPRGGGSVAGGDEFLAWRLENACGGEFRGEGGFASMPRVERRSMPPARFERRFLRHGVQGEAAAKSAAERRRLAQWPRVAILRRLLLLILVLLPSLVASGFMLDVLPHQGKTPLEVVIVVFFGALFGWISIGFWTAMFGFFTLVGRPDRFAITQLGASGDEQIEIGPEVRTAIVMPICEEPVERVFAGLAAIHQSVERAGALGLFDFFILSDSSDPDTWVREEEAWAGWCRAVGGFGRIFYRRRRVRLKRKSGNVADFCRRWGNRYRYMIMLDADSIMSGKTLKRLVELMERHPHAGMIQTAPVAVNRRSLFARVQQFGSRVYGPMFAAGLHFWQLGDGQYWGHNTIIRLAPFADHCGLPRLSGKPPLGGDIMSHDFVEAALMGRAGFTLWLAFDLDGSYEETPSSLLEEMKRDRRWCQGNLQHLRLLRAEGLFGAHRALFVNGVLSYVSALLWFCFLIVSTAEAVLDAFREPDYFPAGLSLFPEWPVWRPNWALALLAVTGMILFLPKVLSVLLILFKRRDARAYGGALRLIVSVFLEILLSSLLAPIRMLFHSRFVVQNVFGRTVTWRSQEREDAETGWRESLYHHGLDTVLATVWGSALFWLNPDYFWWVTPILTALVLSVPASVLASRVRLGERARSLGLFLIPEETDPPAELRDLARNLSERQAVTALLSPLERQGFVRAAVDPGVNAIHRALLRRPRSLRASIRESRRALLERALAGGPAALDQKERKRLLYDPALVDELHRRVWQLPEREQAARWGRPGYGPAA